jgi:SprT protein
MTDYRQLLQGHLPEGSDKMVLEWINDSAVLLRVSPSRHSKLGTYHPPHNGHTHYITINGDLHPFTFLIILVHEIAHAITWERYRNRVRPHGAEWKNSYRNLMRPLLAQHVFPADVTLALEHYLGRAYASIVTDTELTRVLQRYQAPERILLDDVPVDTIFRLTDGRRFRKKEKLRKRIRCICLDNRRFYLFNPVTQINPVEQ